MDNEDYEHLIKWKWHDSHGYAKRIKTFSYKNHRIWSMQNEIMNPPIGKIVDHIDRNPLNNQKYNLRICTKSQNAINSKISKNNSSGFNGVYWQKDAKKWRARVKVNYKIIHLGYFDNKIEAAKAYNKATKKYFGEFARLNDL